MRTSTTLNLSLVVLGLIALTASAGFAGPADTPSADFDSPVIILARGGGGGGGGGAGDGGGAGAGGPGAGAGSGVCDGTGPSGPGAGIGSGAKGGFDGSYAPPDGTELGGSVPGSGTGSGPGGGHGPGDGTGVGPGAACPAVVPKTVPGQALATKLRGLNLSLFSLLSLGSPCRFARAPLLSSRVKYPEACFGKLLVPADTPQLAAGGSFCRLDHHSGGYKGYALLPCRTDHKAFHHRGVDRAG